jgi:uncharacterized membrane protein SpoIIM required for sporulation
MEAQLKSAAFRAEREAAWRELEGLVARVEADGVERLAAHELSRLPVLYRGALSSLSVARAISLDRNVLDYLETLCARAYLAVYGARRTLREALADFFLRRFPQAVRDHRWQLVVASALLLAGTLTGFALTLADADRYYSFVGEAMAGGRDPASSTEALREALYTPRSTSKMLSTFAMWLFSHNARIGLMAFAVGLAGGAPAALVLFANGLTLGAFAALYHSRGLSLDLWGWLLPHGITELGAVALCGAAGLALGQALLFPGRSERLAGLAARGREAAVVATGAVVMLFGAGLIEGIFRQLVHAVPVRYGLAATTAVFWAFYFTRVGKGPR